jgi:hypothetical protein
MLEHHCLTRLKTNPIVRMLENKSLRNIPELEKEDITGQWKIYIRICILYYVQLR